MAHDVFISHSSKDKTVGDAICANLEAAGVRCWIAPRDIAPGEDWPKAIATAISQSQIMVLIFSANANESEQISRELSLAADYKLVIIPFKIDNTIPEPGKQYYLSRTHWLDAMNPPTKEQIKILVTRVKTILSAVDEEKSKLELTVAPSSPPITTPAATEQVIMEKGKEPRPKSTRTNLVAQKPSIPKKVTAPPAESTRTKQKAHEPAMRVKGTGLRRLGMGAALLILVGAAGWLGFRFLNHPAQPVNLPSATRVSPSAASTSRPTSTPTLPATSTNLPTTTPSTSPTAGPTAFYDPILAYINTHAPSFEDDFSNPRNGWGNVTEGDQIYYLVADGTLTIRDYIEPNVLEPTPGVKFYPADFYVPGNSFPVNGLFDATDFALQFQVQFGSLKSVGIQFRSKPTQDTSIPDIGYRFTLTPQGNWDLKFNQDGTLIAEGQKTINPYTFTKVLLIVRGGNGSIFLNDQLLYDGNGFSTYLVSNRIFIYGGADKSTGHFDNFKFWNLFHLDF